MSTIPSVFRPRWCRTTAAVSRGFWTTRRAACCAPRCGARTRACRVETLLDARSAPATIPCEKCGLEVDARPKLNSTIAADRSHVPERNRIRIGRDSTKSMAIERIEQFGPELHSGAFVHREVLLQRDILAAPPETANLRHR